MSDGIDALIAETSLELGRIDEEIKSLLSRINGVEKIAEAFMRVFLKEDALVKEVGDEVIDFVLVEAKKK